MAAIHTCPDKQLHSVHARFLRAVPCALPVELAVERLSDGRRLAHRRVAIERSGKRLFELSACFAGQNRPPLSCI
jgi:acyl-CoA thioesterase-2